MPERLDLVTVRVPMGTQTISWDAHKVLLTTLEQKQTAAELDKDALDHGVESNAAAIRARFEAVGASRPVELSADEKILLCMLLRYWDWQQRAWGSDVIRNELLALLAALERGDPSDSTLEHWGEGDDLGEWRWGQWGSTENSKSDDHSHCPFCNTRFSDRSEVDYDLDEGWVGHDESGYEWWVCPGCFDKLHERLGWKVEARP